MVGGKMGGGLSEDHVEGVFRGIATAEKHAHIFMYVLREGFTKYLSSESLPLEHYFFYFSL